MTRPAQGMRTRRRLIGALALGSFMGISGLAAAAPTKVSSDPILSYLYEWGQPGTGTGRFRAVRGIVAYDRKETERPIIVVADGGRDLLRSYTWNMMFIDKWGGPGVQPGEFREPRGVAVDKEGNVIVADARNHRLQKTTVGTKTFLDRPGIPILTIGSRGKGNGEFDTPTGVAVDSSGAIIVVDTENHRVQKLDPGGKFMLTWGAKGSGDGEFYKPSYVALDSKGLIYIADSGNNRIQVFDRQGKFLSKFGTVGSGPGHFAEPKGLAIDAKDNVWVIDRRNHRLQKFSLNGKLLGTFGKQGPNKGEFSFPEDLAFDSAGRLYVTDGMNGRIQVFKPI